MCNSPTGYEAVYVHRDVKRIVLVLPVVKVDEEGYAQILGAQGRLNQAESYKPFPELGPDYASPAAFSHVRPCGTS